MKKVNIYLIQDCDGLKYVGSTTSKLNRRLSKHKSHKKTNYGNCSSQKLDLDNCEIYSLEVCNELDRKEREKFWINEFDCVNQRKLDFAGQKHKEYQNQYNKEYRKKNKDEINFFRSRKVVNGCYEFIKMLDEY